MASLAGASRFFGSRVIGPTGDDLTARSASADADPAEIGALQRRLRRLNVLNLLILFSAVAAMVLKPTL